MEILTIDTRDLGDRSYVATDGEVALVVDPQRDLDRLLAVIEERGVRVTHVFETHIHNDYVSGGLELAERTGATYVVGAADDVAFERHGVEPGDVIDVGAMTVEVMASPGHTPGHLAYAVRAGDSDVAVFTGGSMLYGAVGRTDLVTPELTEPLAHDQFRSVRGIADALPETTAVYPTHGFGSFCSSDRNAIETEGTITAERGRNPALTTDDEAAFVRTLLAGYTAYPTYYRHMGPLNRAGASAAPLDLPPAIDDDEVARRIAAREWVIDLRARDEFAGAHRPGALNMEAGDSLATYAGWVVPFGSALTLLSDDDGPVADAVRALARIGYDQVTGRARATGGGLAGASYRVATFADLAGVPDDPGRLVLDVRRTDEWDDGHLEGAVHVHLPDLPDRVGDVPDADEVWVHCGSGFRASIAASLLDRAGRTVVLIDDDWSEASDAGLDIVSDASAA